MNLDFREISNWYQVREISPNVFWVKEPGIVSFYVFRNGEKALFIDSGLGINIHLQNQLLTDLKIIEYEVVCTHAHCDHVGLNSSAKKCALSKVEWEKYVRQNEIEQFKEFVNALEKSNKIPPQMHLKPNSPSFKQWIPSHFLEDGDSFSFGTWNFKTISAPGHTCGSLMFLETTTNFLFSGDILYDGKMYLHLKDSSFDEFSNSVDSIINLLDSNPGITIWPAHNTIPLPPDFPKKVKLAAAEFADGNVQSIGTWPKDSIFENGLIYKSNDVEFVVRSEC